MKSVAVLMLLVLAPSLSNATVCFTNTTTARAGLNKVEFDQKNGAFYLAKYTFCDAERVNLSAQKDSLNTEVQSLKLDKVTLTDVLGEYKTNFIDQNKKLNECVAATPSRMTWFGYGALTAVILGLVGAFAIK